MNGTGKGNYVPAVWSNHQRQGRNHGNQQVYTAIIGVRHPSLKVEGRTELDLVQDEVDGAKRSLEEAHLEVQAVQNKAIERMSQITELLEANLEPGGQQRQVSRHVCWAAQKGKYRVGEMV